MQLSIHFFIFFLVLEFVSTAALNCLVYYPVFVCIAAKSTLSYAIGSLYVWTFLAIDIMWICVPFMQDSKTVRRADDLNVKYIKIIIGN